MLCFRRKKISLLKLKLFFSTDLASNYERLTPREHVLKRPGMYIGQLETSNISTWLIDAKPTQNIGNPIVLHEETNVLDDISVVKKDILYSPALLKIIDEILVNAADNRHRGIRMNYINIHAVYRENKLQISVQNDGASIPIEMHPTEHMYTPQLIFGNLLTGSNFDDTKGLVVGGRHGYGAKLTNIFSNSFEIQIYSARNKTLYMQKWSENMNKVDDPIIEGNIRKLGKYDYTRVLFEPDLDRFLIKGDIGVVQNVISLVERRAYDIAASVGPKVKVTFNDQLIPVTCFKDYIKLFKETMDNKNITNKSTTNKTSNSDEEEIEPPTTKLFYTPISPRWELGLMKTNQPDHMCFVNSLWTARGGSHVHFIQHQIVRFLESAVTAEIEKINKKTLKLDVTKYSTIIIGNAIKSRLFIFLNCLIENPTFDSQGKEYLTSHVNQFSSEAMINESFLKDFAKQSGIVDDIIVDFMRKEQSQLIKATKTKRNKTINVSKLEDAHHAGSSDCSLILTEGDSAKALAVAGLEVVGRNKYGVLPLRGKILNVRQVSASQLLKSAEVMNIVLSLGLDFTKTYGTGMQDQGLRYGKVVLMTDQDNDGSHIKGLVINLFQRFWPELLHNGFIHYIATPLVKVRKTSDGRKTKNILSFYSLQEYDAWRKGEGEFTRTSDDDGLVDINDYTIKYYKGLGTSTSEEAQEYFKNAKKKNFKAFHAQTPESTSDAFDLAFSKKRASDRRKWLESSYVSSSYIDPAQESTAFEDFIHKELIQFSFANNVRSIPCAMDGLKPAQRKVLYACFKRKLDYEMKVVQLAGYVAEQTAYHHGEASLHSTIINMAQDYVGANNLPLLVPVGQFGTRSQGGKDFASPRYIFTQLSPFARLIFPPADDDLLEYVEEDGQAVEPKYYIPIIPMLLVNGSEGIGTGWSTRVYPYSIHDIIEHTICLIQKHKPEKKLQPNVRGFLGTIVSDGNKFISNGVIKRVKTTIVEITELPYGKWTSDYKKLLLKMADAGRIKDIKESHTTNSVNFKVTSTAAILDEMEQGAKGLIGEFKLTSSLLTGNMHAFDSHYKIRKYASPEEICEEHFKVRMDAYVKRKKALESKYSFEEALARSKYRFITSILSGDLVLMKKSGGGGGGGLSYNELTGILISREFEPLEALKMKYLGGDVGDVTADPSLTKDSNHFSYLMNLPIHSLTEERAKKLEHAAMEAKSKLEDIQGKSEADLWMNDLNLLKEKLAKEGK